MHTQILSLFYPQATYRPNNCKRILTSLLLLFLSTILIAPSSQVFGDDVDVEIKILISDSLSVEGAAGNTWDLFSFPNYNSNGVGVLSARFIQAEGDFPRAGSGFLELTGLNTAKLLFRDKDREVSQLTSGFSTSQGLIYSAKPKDETQLSIFNQAGTRIESEGGITWASEDGTVVFTDIVEGFIPNISVIRGQTSGAIVTRNDHIPGITSVTFNGLHRVHVNPNGRVAFASSLLGDGVDFTNDWGIFRESSAGVLQTVAREGDPYPADPRLPVGGIFIDIATNQTGFGFNGMGAVAFTALNTNDQTVFGDGHSLWYMNAGGELSLIATSAVNEITPNDGTVVFEHFTYSLNGAKIQPLVDYSGAVIFVAIPLIGTNSGPAAIWKWTPPGSEESGLKKIIDLVSLPFRRIDDQPIENKSVEAYELCLSPTGRIALLGTVSSGGSSLAQAIWAQDENGDFANIITRSPFNDTTYARQYFEVDEGAGWIQIVHPDTEGAIKAVSLGLSSGVYNDASGGEDGLMNPWWTPSEKLLFALSIPSGGTNKSFICEATVGEIVGIPSGDTYRWNGGANTNDWHTINEGKSNWVDSVGIRWDRAPGSLGNEKVIIPNGFEVEINANAEIRDLTLGTSKLSIASNLDFSHTLTAETGSTLEFISGKLSSEGGDLIGSGSVIKSGAEVFTIDIDDVKLTNSSLTVKSGDLVSKNTISNLENITLLVEDGSFTLDENLTVIKGNATTLTVEKGTLDFQSFGLQFETNTTFHTAESVGSIKLGRTEASEAAFLKLHTGGATSPRTLTFTGVGSFEIRQNIELEDNDKLFNNHTGTATTGLTIDILGGKFLLITDFADFTNNGFLKIKNGGLGTADLDSIGSIVNNGTIDLLKIDGDPFRQFDCTNKGTINQYGNVHYNGYFSNQTKSVYNLYGSTLQPKNLQNDYDEDPLSFQKGSKLIVHEGESKIQTVDTRFEVSGNGFPDINFNSSITIQKGASLELINAAFGGNAEIELIDESSLITSKDTLFESLKIVGKGTCKFSSLLRSASHDNTEEKPLLEITNSHAELDSCSIETDGDFLADIILGGESTIHDIADPQTTLMSSTAITYSATLTIRDSSTLTLEDDFSLGGELINHGHVILKTSIAQKSEGAKFSNGVVNGYETGKLNIPDNLASIVIHPKFLTQFDDSLLAVHSPEKFATSVTVGENSTLIIANPAEQFFKDKTLLGGHWVTKDGGSLTLSDGKWPTTNPLPEIDNIGKFAHLKLGRTPAGTHSINSFPNRTSALVNKGFLHLENHEASFSGFSLINQGFLILTNSKLLMGIGTFTNNGSFDPDKDSEVKGNVKSIRGEVGGVIKLAGNLNIDGDLETNGVLSLGASPGSGLITGDLTLLPGSEMIVEFAGKEAGTEFDFLEINGTATLDGKLTLSLIDEYLPDMEDNFQFIEAGSIVGAFSSVDQANRKRRFEIEENAEGLLATAKTISIANYSDWRSLFFDEADAVDDLISGPNADPDFDGISNLIEYLSGGLPQTVTPSPFVLASTAPETFVLELANDVSDFVWSIQTTTDFKEWSPLELDTSELWSDDEISILGLEQTTPTDSEQRFYRLAIEPAD